MGVMLVSSKKSRKKVGGKGEGGVEEGCMLVSSVKSKGLPNLFIS